MRIAEVVVCTVALSYTTGTAAQEAHPPVLSIEHLECPAEVDLSPEVFHERRPISDALAHLRFCGVEGVRIPTVELDWNPAALDVRFEIVGLPDTDVEIRLGARVFSASGLEISNQSRTFVVRAGRTKTFRLRLSWPTRWLQEYGDRLQLVVFDIAPS